MVTKHVWGKAPNKCLENINYAELKEISHSKIIVIFVWIKLKTKFEKYFHFISNNVKINMRSKSSRIIRMISYIKA